MLVQRFLIVFMCSPRYTMYNGGKCMRISILELIIVEGRDDQNAILRSVDAFVLRTNGTAISIKHLQYWRVLAETRGICVFTDPDGPGQRIRDLITNYFPHCLSAHLPKGSGRGPRGKIGVAYASNSIITSALLTAGCHEGRTDQTLHSRDLIDLGLSGHPNSTQHRAHLANILQIPNANAKQFAKEISALGLHKEDVKRLLF